MHAYVSLWSSEFIDTKHTHSSVPSQLHIFYKPKCKNRENGPKMA